MPKTVDFIADHLPRVTVKDVRNFFTTVDIRDANAFAAELQAFVYARVEAMAFQARLDGATAEGALARKAARLRAAAGWTPRETDIQRGRAAMLEVFAQPHNLLVPDFARMADKSRQQIYKDIEARRLLTLSVGPRGQKLPDWQLDPVKQQLTQSVIQQVGDVDMWTVYRALSEPLESLGGCSPVEAVTACTIDDVAKAVFNVLGIHAH